MNVVMYKMTLCLVLLCAMNLASEGQSTSTNDTLSYHEYNVNKSVSLAISGVGLVATKIGHDLVRKKPEITEEQIQLLDPKGVAGIDQLSLRQDISNYEQALKTSDLGIQYGPILPALLLLDKRIRTDWLDYMLVYIESQVIVNTVYNWTFLGPQVVERFRPIVYYDQLDFEDRNWGGNRNSFYSGHTSTVATATFFMAQSYLNYHPEKAHNAWLYYSLAAAPPLFIGYKRIQGLKHFPSDVLAGLLVGVASGAFYPRLHREKNEPGFDLSMVFQPDVKMLSLKYTF